VSTATERGAAAIDGDRAGARGGQGPILSSADSGADHRPRGFQIESGSTGVDLATLLWPPGGRGTQSHCERFATRVGLGWSWRGRLALGFSDPPVGCVPARRMSPDLPINESVLAFGAYRSRQPPIALIAGSHRHLLFRDYHQSHLWETVGSQSGPSSRCLPRAGPSLLPILPCFVHGSYLGRSHGPSRPS
jgi:hypothetical protein